MLVEIITPQRTVLKCPAQQVLVPGQKAPFAMLDRHQAIVSSLEEKQVVITQPDGARITVQLEGISIVEHHDDLITILATKAQVL